MRNRLLSFTHTSRWQMGVVAALMVLALTSFFCLYYFYRYNTESKFTTLEEILEAGKITVITRNSAHCYYLYKDQAMGFEYDLAKAFADYLGVKLNVKTAEMWEEMVSALTDGTGAFIAASTTATPKRREQVAFSNGYMAVWQHIIVHRNNPGISRAEDLAGKTVHVREGTSYQELLEALRKDGIDLVIKLHNDLPTEELIRQVEEEEIEITIAYSNIALLNRMYYPRTVIASAIGEKEYLRWATSHGADRLLERINSFFEMIKENGEFEEIYNRYYANVGFFDYVDLRAYHRRLETELPRYKPIIKEAAKRHGFDWKLIAAQMYQESHFNSKARSHAGALGLMQLMPRTARSLGVKNIFDPVENINAGVQYLSNLYDLFGNVNSPDRLLIALAAYNVGRGHIFDAQNLARKKNLDPYRWLSLSKTLPLLSQRKYYKHARHGYCRGREPVKYVRQIMIYYDILRHHGIEYKTDAPSRT